MNKIFKVLMAVATCLVMCASVVACDWENNNNNEENTAASVRVVKATQTELANLNAEGVTIFGTDETVSLETAYWFSARETVEAARASEYANWIADYYVSVDTAVEAGKLGLAGAYEAWQNNAWVAFYNPYDLEANQPIGLLETAGGAPWTYADIVEYVSEFRCGAFDYENACAGVTLKVELRLTNPDNAEDIYTVHVEEYTFAA